MFLMTELNKEIQVSVNISYLNIVCHQHVGHNPCGICSDNQVLHYHSCDSERRFARIHLCLHCRGLALETQRRNLNNQKTYS